MGSMIVQMDQMKAWTAVSTTLGVFNLGSDDPFWMVLCMTFIQFAVSPCMYSPVKGR